jgi:hypothetical protein
MVKVEHAMVIYTQVEKQKVILIVPRHIVEAHLSQNLPNSTFKVTKLDISR